jgi:hypothetical protein
MAAFGNGTGKRGSTMLALQDHQRSTQSGRQPVELPELRANVRPAPLLGVRRGQPRQRQAEARRAVGLRIVQQVQHRVQGSATHLPRRSLTLRLTPPAAASRPGSPGAYPRSPGTPSPS